MKKRIQEIKRKLNRKEEVVLTKVCLEETIKYFIKIMRTDEIRCVRKHYDKKGKLKKETKTFVKMSLNSFSDNMIYDLLNTGYEICENNIL